MIAPLAAGGLVGFGLWLAWQAAMPARTPLAVALDRLDRPAPRRALQWRDVTGLREQVGGWLAEQAAARGWLSSSLRADLAILDRTAADLFARQAAGAVGGLLGVPLLATAGRLAGLRTPLLVPLWLTLVTALVLALAPVPALRRAAVTVRRDYRTATAALLDLIAMRTASGAGVAEAVRDAAGIGAGRPYARLRAALADARTTGLSTAGALDALGAEIDLPELRDLAAALALVETAGAHADSTLRAKASSLRDREVADLHGRANERTQSMLVAQAVLGVGFLLLLGYPALVTVVTV